ncbi:MAG TPA: hypothetical protein VF428_06145 [Casimicrobiaceae bacterium]
MTSNRFRKCSTSMLAAVAALTAAASLAADPVPPASQKPAPVTYAQAGPVAMTVFAAPASAQAPIRAMEAGVRKAASEGPTALRRYVTRTEPIYHFSYWDYAKYLPREER